ncbi:MAG: amidohydrolase family protein, partial [Pseudomonadota bacterium]|nr:amidohydrolase family protein [Pseudomonadota bacterium]
MPDPGSAPRPAPPPDLPITNCHVHAFTLDHVPDGYLPFGLMAALRNRTFRTGLIWTLRRLLPFERRDRFERAARFAAISSRHAGQEGVLRAVRGYYPRGTRFVVLPMDMAHMGKGRVPEDLPAQHDALARIASQPELAGTILPFATVHPARGQAGVDELRRCLDMGFRGVKLYPPLGYPPDHDLLMEQVYPLCLERDVPVISHCSRGGVGHSDLERMERDWRRPRGGAEPRRFASPHAFRPVMEAFPALRVNLAHFGGAKDWKAYLEEPMAPGDQAAREANWLTAILDMLGDPRFPNLYTDISYTIFYFDEYFPVLRVFLDDPAVRAKVLFGSDFYMAEMETLPERSLSIRLRHALGDDLFRRIACANPERWLTGRDPDAPDAGGGGGA